MRAPFWILTVLLVAPACAGEAEGAEAAAQGAGAAPGETEEAPAAWPIFRGDPGLTGVAQGSLPASPELLWTYEAGGAITSSPVVADGLVTFGSDDYAIHCLDAETGEKRWSFATEDIVEAPPLVVDGGVYVGSSDFFFYALDARTGELRWKFETDDKILGGANYQRREDGGLTVLVGSYDTHLYGFDAATGEKLWAYATENYVNGTPAVSDGKAIFGGCDAVLHVVSTETGERLSGVELGSECHVAGSAAFVDGKAYFGHYGNQFVCVDVATGTSVWEYDGRRQPFFSSPAIGADRIVVGGRDKRLHCMRRSDGEPLWTFATRRKIDGSPVIAGDAVVFGSGDGRLYLVDLATGEERWTYDVGKSIISSPAVVDGKIFVGANDARLYAFGARAQDGGAER
jgi:outer membrane protein assembly factor BamB